MHPFYASHGKPWWGLDHPKAYRFVDPTKGVWHGWGVMHNTPPHLQMYHTQTHPNDALFNLCVWQSDFISPAKHNASKPYDLALQWMVANLLSTCEVHGHTVGDLVLGPPIDFLHYIKDQKVQVKFAGKNFTLRNKI